MRPNPRNLGAIATAALLAATFGGCADDGDAGAASTTTVPGADQGEPASTPMLLTATDDGFALDVDEVEPGWITLTVRNDTDAPLDATVMRIRDGRTIGELTAELATDGRVTLVAEPDGGGHLAAGGVSMVPPGAEQTFMTEVFEGPHVVGWLTQLVDGDATHVAPFDVGAGDPPLDDPETEGHVLIQDFSFVFDEAMRQPGNRRVTIAMDGPSLHELRVYRVREGIEPGLALEALKALPQAPDETTDEVEPVVGIGPAATPLRNVADIDLDEGAYVAACFLPDPATGTPHAGLGMVAQLIVAP